MLIFPVAGIDVSCKTLDLVIRKKEKNHTVRHFDNTPAAHLKIVEFLKKQQVKNICLEATGTYHLDLAVVLSQTESLAVMVVNPRAAKHFSQALMKRTKTDAVDAAMLAEYAQRMDFKSWKAPSQTMLTVRACSRRIATLTKDKTRAKNQLHALQATRHTPLFIIEDVQLSISQLENQLEQLITRACTLIEQTPALNETAHLLMTVKGLAEKTMIQLIGELGVLDSNMTAKQWVAYAGLNPRQHQSGSSVNGKTSLSKGGNSFIRSALYMPALNASYRDPHISAYYQHLIQDNGLTKLQALCAIMRKLLHAIHGMLKTKSPFQGALFYSAATSVSSATSA